jgi:hypothetical protein
MTTIVDFDVFRDHLHVAADSPEVSDVALLLDAISAEVRRISRLGLEGAPTDYDEVLRVFGVLEFRLPHVPVASIASIRKVNFDGTEEEPYATTDWRLEDADRGRIHLRTGSSWLTWRRMGPEYLRVIWTVTGAIGAAIVQASLEWGRDRWVQIDRSAGLASYATGNDSESYFAQLAGLPPRGVMRALLGERVSSFAGVVT